jgi:DEAD/DEAH box helicase domain-containing protein
LHVQTRSVSEVLARWRSQHRVAPNLIDVREMAGRSARWVEIPALDPRLVAVLWDRGVTRLYSHQAEAIAALAEGNDVVVATPTASGKSLCYQLPVFDALLSDPSARALWLFPTKALARDQIEASRTLAQAIGARDLGIAVYDGDTPPDQRRAARQRGRVIATNPDMLHAGILPHHAQWASFFAGLRYVVVDEIHTCRGVFGAGVANVLRRLRRVAAFHGASPRFVATSATIANPGELAERVLGSDPARLKVIAESGAPAGARTFVLYNPPVVDSALGLRASYLKEAKRLTRDLIDAGVATLVFGRSRRAVEILVRYLRDDLDADGEEGGDDAVRGYRGGYLPDRRREVERLLRDGETRCVVATSALELGIDVGGLDAVVIAGWPGSRAAVWQRAGRAGRRGGHSLVVLVACSEPLDQYVAGDPEFLFGAPVEAARLDPDNPAVLAPHFACAAFELPFAPGEGYGPMGSDEAAAALRLLAGRGLVHEDGQGRGFHWVGDAYPAQSVPLRGGIDENFAIIDVEEGGVLAEVDRRDAARQLFVNAIVPIEARLHRVERLDWDQHQAFVRPVDVDYTTEAMTVIDVRVLDTRESAPPAGWGDVHVEEKVVGFKKIKLHTHENVGYGEVALPSFAIDTRALWFDPRPPANAWGASWIDGVARAAYALEHVAALLVLCDGADLGRATVAMGRSGGGADAAAATLPRIYLYDAIPGGAGLSARLFEERRELVRRAVRLVRGCGCRRGCPACVGALASGAGDAKGAAAALLEELERRMEVN